jgi:hypothetical protein
MEKFGAVGGRMAIMVWSCARIFVTVVARIDLLPAPAILFTHPTPLMNIVTNYSLEFGVVLRAVCPTRAGLGG